MRTPSLRMTTWLLTLALALPGLAYDQADRLGLARALGWR